MSIIEHVTPADGNIFADLGFGPEEAENLLMRADLMMAIEKIILARKLKQREAAALFGVSQPRISDLKRGHMDAFTIDSLVNMLAHAGFRLRVSIEPRPDVPEGAEASPPRALRASA